MLPHHRFSPGRFALIALVALAGGPPFACEPVHQAETANDVQRPRMAMPNDCSGEAELGSGCLPDPGWAQQVCRGVYPDVALYMLRGGTPWQRLYMTARMAPFNASPGGVSVLDGTLEPGEELLALRRLGSESVSRTEGFEALRWDGSCVTLHDGEYTLSEPPRLRHAHIEWPNLSDPVQRQLRSDGDVNHAFRQRRNECKGAYFGPVSDRCVEKDRVLTDAIVSYVRTGPELPLPNNRP